LNALIFNIQKFCLHDGKGIRTTIFFKGCNLRCQWCTNPESLALQPEIIDGEEVGKYYTLEEVMAEVLKDKPFFERSGGGVTLSGGEPLLQAGFILELCDALHAEGISVGIETAANVSTVVFTNVLRKCDFVYIDLKHWNSARYKEGTGVDNARILKNIRQAFAMGISTTIRIPLIPGFNSSLDDARAFASLLKELGARDVHVLPFHQMGESKYKKHGIPYAYAGVPQMHDEDADGFAAVLEEAGLNVQIGG
jgi:pyruvate formate lyase activating enzyme